MENIFYAGNVIPLVVQVQVKQTTGLIGSNWVIYLKLLKRENQTENRSVKSVKKHKE